MKRVIPPVQLTSFALGLSSCIYCTGYKLMYADLGIFDSARNTSDGRSRKDGKSDMTFTVAPLPFLCVYILYLTILISGTISLHCPEGNKRNDKTGDDTSIANSQSCRLESVVSKHNKSQ